MFAKPFAKDTDYFVINGMYIKGGATIESAHQRIFDTVYKVTTLSLTVKQIRFLRPDVAVVHVIPAPRWADKRVDRGCDVDSRDDEREAGLDHPRVSEHSHSSHITAAR